MLQWGAQKHVWVIFAFKQNKTWLGCFTVRHDEGGVAIAQTIRSHGYCSINTDFFLSTPILHNMTHGKIENNKVKLIQFLTT